MGTLSVAGCSDVVRFYVARSGRSGRIEGRVAQRRRARKGLEIRIPNGRTTSVSSDLKIDMECGGLDTAFAQRGSTRWHWREPNFMQALSAKTRRSKGRAKKTVISFNSTVGVFRTSLRTLRLCVFALQGFGARASADRCRQAGT